MKRWNALRAMTEDSSHHLTDRERAKYKAKRLRALIIVLDRIRASDDWVATHELWMMTEMENPRTVRRYLYDLAAAGLIVIRKVRTPRLPHGRLEAKKYK